MPKVGDTKLGKVSLDEFKEVEQTKIPLKYIVDE
jgi:hypothetical protein